MQTVELGETQPIISNDPELVHVAIGRASVDCSLVLLASILAKIVVYACLISTGSNTRGVSAFGNWMIATASNASLGCDFGIFMFLAHCLFLFPNRDANRMVPVALALLYIGAQLVVVSGFLLFPFVPYAISVVIVGWLFQRFLGLCLSLNGDIVRLPPLSVGLYLALPALLILIGIIPACFLFGWLRNLNADLNPDFDLNFSRLTIYLALWLIAGCGIPLAWMYLCLWVVHRRLETKLTLVFIALVIFMLLLGLSSVLQTVILSLNSMLFVSAYTAGVLIMYGCFYKNGLSIVWAKRLALKETQKDVAFDDLV
jgi:hypothetical protein